MVSWARGLSGRQWVIVLIAWFGWVFDIMDTALFNFAKVPMLTQMLGGPAQYKLNGPVLEGRIQALFLLGWALGGLVFGVMADRMGRTRTLVFTILLYCGCTSLTALCRTPEQVMFARFLTALGIGGEWAAGAALVAESLPDRARAAAAALLQTAAAAGPVFAALANLFLRGQPWQWLFVIGIFPAMVCVFVRSKVHEPTQRVQKVRQPLAEVFGVAELRKRALAAMIVGAVGVAGAGTATYWTPNLVKSVSLGLDKATVDARTSYVVMISHLGTLAGVLLVPWLCERLGRRKTIALFYALAPLAVVVAIGSGATYTRLLLLLPLVNFFAIGVSASFALYFPELFPGPVRATGAGLAYNVGRLLSIPMPIFTAAVTGALGGSIGAGVAMSGSVYLLGLLGLPFLPETRGQSLRE